MQVGLGEKKGRERRQRAHDVELSSTRYQQDVRCGEYALDGTNRMADAENMLLMEPNGWQMRRIFSSWDQTDGRCGECALHRTKRMADAENMLGL